mmetsp:Transcript_48126/g.114654  ORF Transcript_48126/g.114654 Transcript_48126/m.114654 type:complete len:299 (-) Transcript_48126:2907-3803(-)
MPDLLTTPTCPVALVPAGPGGDLAVHAVSTAGHLPQPAHAGQARVGRLLLDDTVAEAHGPVFTGGPMHPRAKLAVLSVFMAGMRVALHSFFQPVFTWHATTSGRDLDLSCPRLHAAVAARGADGPGFPEAQLAIFHFTSAGRSLLGGALALIAPVDGRCLDAARLEPLVLGAEALALPLTPVSEDAVHGEIAVALAPLRLQQRSVAHLPATAAFLGDCPMTLTKLSARGIRPGGPWVEDAVLWGAARAAGQLACLSGHLAAAAGAVHRGHEEEAVLHGLFLLECQLTLPHTGAQPTAA